MARIAARSEDWPTAVREYNASVTWSPNGAGAHYGLAAALKAGGYLEEAAQELQIAQKLGAEVPYSP